MTSIMIEDEYVFVGGSAKGKIEDLLLFIGVKNSLTESKKGFCLFLDGRFWIQEGSAIHEGVADPMERGGIYKLFSFFKREDECSWSWQVKNEHLIWVGDRQFIIPLGSSIIAFEDPNGDIAMCKDHKDLEEDEEEICKDRNIKVHHPGSRLLLSSDGTITIDDAREYHVEEDPTHIS